MSDADIAAKLAEIQKRYEDRIQGIKKKTEERVETIEENAPKPNNGEAAVGVTFDIKWKVESFKFDIPKVSMEREVVKFDVPEVRMVTEDFSFDLPTVRMVTKCIGKKPEFYGFPPKVRWTCIYADVPEVGTRRVEIKTDIPKFNSKRVEVKFDKPNINMETVEIKFSVPQFYLRSVEAQLNETERQADEVGREMTGEIAVLQSEMEQSIEAEIGIEVHKLFDEKRTSIVQKRSEICAGFDDAIDKTKSAIRILRENNVVDEVNRLEVELSKVISDYKKTLEEIDGAIESLNKSEDEAIRGIRSR